MVANTRQEAGREIRMPCPRSGRAPARQNSRHECSGLLKSITPIGEFFCIHMPQADCWMSSDHESNQCDCIEEYWNIRTTRYAVFGKTTRWGLYWKNWYPTFPKLTNPSAFQTGNNPWYLTINIVCKNSKLLKRKKKQNLNPPDTVPNLAFFNGIQNDRLTIESWLFEVVSFGAP